MEPAQIQRVLSASDLDPSVPLPVAVGTPAAPVDNPGAQPAANPDPAPATPIPSSTTPATPAPSPAQVVAEDYSDFGVKSKDELKERWSNLTKLQEKVEQDSYTKKWLEASSQGISKANFDLAYDINPSKMSDAEKVALAKQLKEGLTTEDTEFLVSREYQIGDDYDDPTKFDPDEVRASRIKLARDAKEAEKYLQQFVEEAQIPPAQRNQKLWGDTTKAVLQDAAKISITLDQIGEVSYSAKDKPDVMKKLKETADSIMGAPGFNFKPDEEGKAFLKNALRQTLFSMVGEDMIKDFIAQKEQIAKARELANKVNPSALPGEPAPTGSPMSADEKMAKGMAAAFGRTRE